MYHQQQENKWGESHHVGMNGRMNGPIVSGRYQSEYRNGIVKNGEWRITIYTEYVEMIDHR